MKKFICTCLLLSSIIIYLACDKDQIEFSDIDKTETILQELEGISSDGRMLIFSTTEDYKKIVNDPSKEIRLDFSNKVKKLQHTTYAEHLALSKAKNNYDLIDDDDLSQILNKDCIVQIGDYLYRINKPNESVYVLPAKNISEYHDLVNENKKNENIRKFSTSEDVLELAESASEGQKSWFCAEAGVSSRSQSASHGSQIGSTEGTNTTLRHKKYGIYFTIVMESNSNWALSQFKFAFSSNSERRRYKRKCKPIEYVPYSGNNQWESLMSVSSAKYKIRESATNFSKYHIRARCNYYHNDLFMTESVLVSSSPYLEIRVNL